MPSWARVGAGIVNARAEFETAGRLQAAGDLTGAEATIPFPSHTGHDLALDTPFNPLYISSVFQPIALPFNPSVIECEIEFSKLFYNGINHFLTVGF